MKKVLCSWLIVMMVVCFMPTMAFADTQMPTTYEVSTADELVNAFNEISSATGNVVININADIDMTEKVACLETLTGKKVTINGNEKTITNMTKPLFEKVAGSGSLEVTDVIVKDSNIAGRTVEYEQSAGVFVCFVDYPGSVSITNCNLDNVTVTSSDWTGGFIGYSSQVIVITGGSVKNCTIVTTGDGSIGSIIGQVAGGGTIDGVVTSNNTIKMEGAARTEKTGTILGTHNAGTLNLNVIEETSSKIYTNASQEPIANPTAFGRVINNVDLQITGGVYNSNPVIDGNSNGNPNSQITVIGESVQDNTANHWVIAKAKIDSVYYANLKEAVAAAKPGETITLLADDADEAVILNKAITIDKAGKTIQNAPTAGSGYIITDDAANGRITAEAVAIGDVIVTPTTLSLEAGKTGTVTAAVTAATEGETVDTTVTWTSSDTSVATVDAAGKVTAVAAGTATITATSAADNTKSAACTVTVTAQVQEPPQQTPSTGGSYYNPVEIQKILAGWELDRYVDMADYDAEEQAVLQQMVKDQKALINKATSVDAVKEALTAAKAALDTVPTAAEKKAQAEAEAAAIEAAKEEVRSMKLTARSQMSALKGKTAVKVWWYNASGEELDLDGVYVYRSTKRYNGYGKKPFFQTSKDTYYNTAIKSGEKYYYYVIGYKEIDGEIVLTPKSKKAWRTVKGL